jgi:hypothetical protein
MWLQGTNSYDEDIERIPKFRYTTVPHTSKDERVQSNAPVFVFNSHPDAIASKVNRPLA